MDAREAATRVRALGVTLVGIADGIESGRVSTAEPLDLAVAQLKGVRIRAFGRRQRSAESARDRLRAYFVQNVGEEIPGEELAEVAGISEWARRVRELRAEGLSIGQVGVGIYRLDGWH